MKPKSTEPQQRGVLCGTDFSKAAAQAADVACALAKCLHAPLELVHVHAPLKGPPPERKLSAEATRLRQHGVEIHETMLEGVADEAMVKQAKRKSCQLVVVASLGKRGLERWVLGSVSERTAERSTVPTLVVRDSAPFLAWTRGERALKVFVAFNHTPTSEAALIWVKNLQAIGPFELVVGYVDSPPEQLARLGSAGALSLVGNPPDLQSILERELKARVMELLGPHAARIRVEPNWGRPDAPLAGMAMQESADLVVGGSHQYHGFERLWKTSVSSGLLHSAAMSVAVVPLTTGKLKTVGIAPTIRKVLTTTDFSDLANLAIPHAYSLLRSGGTLHLITVIHPHELPGGEFAQGPLDRDFEKQHAKYIGICQEKLRALIPAEAVVRGIQTEVEVVEHADAGVGISQAAERFGADVICMGTHGGSGLLKLLPGSVAQKMLARSSRPLLLVRPPLKT